MRDVFKKLNLKKSFTKLLNSSTVKWQDINLDENKNKFNPKYEYRVIINGSTLLPFKIQNEYLLLYDYIENNDNKNKKDDMDMDLEQVLVKIKYDNKKKLFSKNNGYNKNRFLSNIQHISRN